jgi:hypothetical protein
MTFDDEAVMAYVDGELDASTRAAFEKALAADGELAERVARQQRLRGLLRESYDPVLDEPVPARLQQALAGAPAAPRSVPAPSLLERLLQWLRPLAAPQALAMAACAMFGVAIGVSLRAPGGAFDTVDGRLVARGALAQALNDRLSGEPAADGVRVGLSFVAQQGHYCRSFVLQSPSTAGLACHADGGWRLELVTAPAGGGASPAYRQAGSEMPPEVLRAVDERIFGNALDAAGEKVARERGWKR